MVAAAVHNGITPMRIVFMGATELGRECCQTLLTMGQEVVGILSIPPEFRISWSKDPVRNVRFRTFDDLADEHGIPILYVTKDFSYKECRQRIVHWQPDILVVIGWYYMVPHSLRDSTP